jgi:hypothetical protein
VALLFYLKVEKKQTWLRTRVQLLEFEISASLPLAFTSIFLEERKKNKKQPGVSCQTTDGNKKNLEQFCGGILLLFSP